LPMFSLNPSQLKCSSGFGTISTWHCHVQIEGGCQDTCIYVHSLGLFRYDIA
jgi:hypothetical protein